MGMMSVCECKARGGGGADDGTPKDVDSISILTTHRTIKKRS